MILSQINLLQKLETEIPFRKQKKKTEKNNMSKRVRNIVVPFNAPEVTRPAKAVTKTVPKPPATSASAHMKETTTEVANELLNKEVAELRAALQAANIIKLPQSDTAPVVVATHAFPTPSTVPPRPADPIIPTSCAQTAVPAKMVPVAHLPLLDQRPTVAYTRLPISEIRQTTDYTRLAVYGRVVEVSPIANKPVQGGHRQLWWIWIVDALMSIQVSIWSGVGTPRGDPPVIPRVGEVVTLTGFSGVLSNGQWDKWHPCQLQAEQSDLKFAYPGSDASLLWDKQLNPARTLQSQPSTPEKKPVQHGGFVMEASPRGVEVGPPLARVLKIGAPRFCTDCGEPLIGGAKHCAESGKLH